jgi:uncharacterized RDD family membrane protein YckC
MTIVDRLRELVGLPTPTLVVTIGGVDHDPMPISLATACGIWLFVGYTTNPPQGTPCPSCFGDRS